MFNPFKVALACILAAAAVLSAAPAAADPDATCDLHNQQLCDPAGVHYCPDTKGFVGWMTPCPSLVTGLTPPQPGGLTSNGGLAQ